MLRVAVVEDNERDANTLMRYLEDFASKNGENIHTEYMSDAFPLLSGKASFDIVLMDIEMPDIDGLTAAKKLREYDKNCCIIFITNMALYAIDGYEVQALDFIVKPVSYGVFCFKFSNAVRVARKNSSSEISIKVKDGIKRMTASEIKYVEVVHHKLYYHTDDGVFETWGQMISAEEKLSSFGFARCNACYLVNLKRISGIYGEYAEVCGERLKISQTKKKEFLKVLAMDMSDL